MLRRYYMAKQSFFFHHVLKLAQVLRPTLPYLYLILEGNYDVYGRLFRIYKLLFYKTATKFWEIPLSYIEFYSLSSCGLCSPPTSSVTKQAGHNAEKKFMYRNVRCMWKKLLNYTFTTSTCKALSVAQSPALVPSLLKKVALYTIAPPADLHIPQHVLLVAVRFL